jgi:7,8-dihydropterin-6-yl-methyl-4-(beta-D-ribofuranosyl)aminobenzene 5'-phosphate synthase
MTEPERRRESFGSARDVAITVLVDNRADLLVKSTDTVRRFTDEALLAEHGFAALIDLKDAGVRVLWDAGATGIALRENARRMEIDLSTVDRIALSHGHRDHTAAITDVIHSICDRGPRKWDKEVTTAEIDRWLSERRVPLIAHPAAFRERWGIGKDGSKYGPMVASPQGEWEAAGAEIVLCEGPYELGPGCWTTGAIPRLSYEKAGIPKNVLYREGRDFVRDEVEDDQALILNIAEMGLVILAGCAHSGIVNTVRHAQRISGVDTVWAILGGFHLAPADDAEVQRTIDEIKALEPSMVAPSHCTGFRAISQFASRMPDQFVLGVVGTTYLF